MRDLTWYNSKLVGVDNSREPASQTSVMVSLDNGTTIQAATDPGRTNLYEPDSAYTTRDFLPITGDPTYNLATMHLC